MLQHEGGRTKPITDKYIQMIFIDTWNMQFRLDLLDGAKMIMPGEQATIRITLPSDMPIFVGQTYTLRENSRLILDLHSQFFHENSHSHSHLSFSISRKYESPDI